MEFASEEECFGIAWVRNSSLLMHDYRYELPLQVLVFEQGFFAVADADKNRVLYADTHASKPATVEAKEFLLNLAYTLI